MTIDLYIRVGGIEMKKLLMLFGLSVLLVACGGNDASDGEVEEIKPDVEEVDEREGDLEEETNSDEIEAITVDKGALNVEVTLPAFLFEEEDIEQLMEEVKSEGVGEVIPNEDGSLTYKMSKTTHKEIMQEMEQDLNNTIEEIKNSEEFASIKNVITNKSLSEFTLLVDREAFENSFDVFATLGLVFSAVFYQLFDGVDPENYEVIINLKDESTGEVFETTSFPEAFEE